VIYLGYLPYFRCLIFSLWFIGLTTVHGKMFGGISFVLECWYGRKYQSFGSSEGTADLALEVGAWHAINPIDDAGDQGH
jgi:hypothetical protein